jgi:1-acyl-sn-glycerol-3-phosphate acyltransferase
MIYKIGHFICRTYFRLFYRWHIIGRENIPADGSLLVVSNHISLLDPPLVGSGMTRQLTFMTKAELFKIPILSWVLRNVGAFPVKRGTGDREALRLALKLLEEDRALLMFPEGTRSKSGEMEKGQSGAAFFALRSKATILPAAVIGTYKLFSKVTLVYGRPLDLTQYREQHRNKETMGLVTQEIMSAIENLLKEHR